MAWEAVHIAVEKDYVMLSMVTETGSPFEAWCALVKVAAEINDAASYRSNIGLENFEVGSSENVGEYFARVNVAL